MGYMGLSHWVESCINPKTGWHLYYDFYIPSKNLLIEYDGYQHYFLYYKDGCNTETLKSREYRDRLKNLWASKNKIKLYRIKYTNVKNISGILHKLMS